MGSLIGYGLDGHASPFSEKEMNLAVDLIHAAHAPSRFSLFGILRDSDGEVWDLELIGRGLQWDSEAIVYLPSSARRESMLWSASSAKSLLARYGRKYDLHLAWIDPEPEPREIVN
jgi:hypothetical protein